MDNFFTRNAGFVETVEGGFSISLDWGFVIGVISTFLILRYVVWYRRFPRKGTR
jgi:hypothetical protein